MNETSVINHEENERIAALLEGRRIVAAELAHGRVEPSSYWSMDYDARLTLDDGTVLYVVPNYGCGGCPNGRYWVESVASVDNVITRAGVTVTAREEYGDRYTIYVVADDVQINAVTVNGDEGNGYYGAGFDLVVEALPAAENGEIG